MKQQKPVNREWLYQKYIVEGLDCTAISKLVNRHSKRVWEWLRDYGIPTRPRGGRTAPGSFKKGEPSKFQGQTHTTKNRETFRQHRLSDGRVPYLKDGKHHLKGKRGADTTNWRGGTTPERQLFYSTPEWKQVFIAVWDRDNGTCQRCSRQRKPSDPPRAFDVHHIIRFDVVETRCDINNLVLLCESCHYWVHSSANTNKEFIHE